MSLFAYTALPVLTVQAIPWTNYTYGFATVTAGRASVNTARKEMVPTVLEHP